MDVSMSLTRTAKCRLLETESQRNILNQGFFFIIVLTKGKLQEVRLCANLVDKDVVAQTVHSPLFFWEIVDVHR